jgi:CDP-paratose 2-epimerase
MNVTKLDGKSIAGPFPVTRGCGFLGSNLVAELARRGRNVALDNLSRAGVRDNAEWLMHQPGNRISIEVANTRNASAIRAAASKAAAVMHLAGQVTVTTSLEDPIEDFEIIVRGTLNVLEAVRQEARA